MKNDYHEKIKYKLSYLSEVDKLDLEAASNRLKEISERKQIDLDMIIELKNLIDALALKREQYLVRYINLIKRGEWED